MAAEARRGERVVRLKGGDPFVFGRGGEEAAASARARPEVEVVNGITAGLAAATSIGVPLTHRDHAHGVIFVTGHARERELTPRLAGASARAPTRWSTIAAAAADGITVVIYMGIATAPELQAALSLRLAGSTPVAIVQHADLAGTAQRRLPARQLGGDDCGRGPGQPGDRRCRRRRPRCRARSGSERRHDTHVGPGERVDVGCLLDLLRVGLPAPWPALVSMRISIGARAALRRLQRRGELEAVRRARRGRRGRRW